MSYIVEIGGRLFRLDEHQLDKAVASNMGRQPVNVISIVTQ